MRAEGLGTRGCRDAADSGPACGFFSQMARELRGVEPISLHSRCGALGVAT